MSHRGPKAGGSFRGDLEQLFEQLTASPVVELGKPLPRDRYLPKRPKARAGRCPAAHNRALIDRAENHQGAD